MKRGSKYWSLFDHLRRNQQDELTMTFSEIETLLGSDLPPSARSHRGWWSNRSVGAVQAAAWMEAGYHVEEIDLEEESVTFHKPSLDYEVQREGNTVLWDGNLVKALRVHMDATQTELADELGVRQQTISEWETGAYAPRRSMSKYLTLVAEQVGFEYDQGE